MKKNTSWGNVAEWYSNHLTDPDSYHNKVILPSLLRLLQIRPGEHILDLACGTGFFSRAFSDAGARVTGVDIGAELIAYAKRSVPNAEFIVSSAHDLSKIQNTSVDKISLVLAIQNIKEVKEMLIECKRVLRSGGKVYIVMNHPAYRIPKFSSWEWVKDTEGNERECRKIDAYLSEKAVEIDMHPGGDQKKKTVSFHRPLQYYSKLFSNTGFAITKIEEWISHKTSEKGPRQKEEDRMRKEIPLFMYVEILAL